MNKGIDTIMDMLGEELGKEYGSLEAMEQLSSADISITVKHSNGKMDTYDIVKVPTLVLRQ